MILFKKLFVYFICPLSIALPLQGCVVVSPKTAQHKADNTIITGSVDIGSVNNGLAASQIALNGDEQAIRQKITTDPNAATLNWTNEATGSSGTMSILNSFVENGVPCRNFKTTRESFNGIMVYEGKACQQQDTSWDVLNIKAL